GVQDTHGSAVSTRIVTDQSARLSVSVRGALDADELAAIEAFLGGIDALATQFYDGDAEAAFAAAAALQVDPQEIVRYSVKLSVRERYAMGAQMPAAPVSYEPLPATPAAVPLAPVAAPSNAATAGAPSTVDRKSVV